MKCEDESGVTWQMSAWGESWQRGRKGKPSFWSLYTFSSLAEAQRTRTRLEKKWKDEPKGPYSFDLYRVEKTAVARPKNRKTK